MKPEKIESLLKKASLNVLNKLREELVLIDQKNKLSNEELINMTRRIICIIILIVSEKILAKDCPIDERISFVKAINAAVIDTILETYGN